jgi:hypothetical protein
VGIDQPGHQRATGTLDDLRIRAAVHRNGFRRNRFDLVSTNQHIHRRGQLAAFAVENPDVLEQYARAQFRRRSRSGRNKAGDNQQRSKSRSMVHAHSPAPLVYLRTNYLIPGHLVAPPNA